jgi:hypothetical protein
MSRGNKHLNVQLLSLAADFVVVARICLEARRHGAWIPQSTVDEPQGRVGQKR